MKIVDSDNSQEEKENIVLNKEIEKIKNLKNKKRKTQYTEETYDQDFIEMKNTKSDQILDGKLIKLKIRCL